MPREMADQPALVEICAHCKERVGLRRHIKEINGRYYAICFDCAEEDD